MNFRFDIQCANCGNHKIITLTKAEVKKAYDVPHVIKYPVCPLCAKIKKEWVKR